MYWRIVAPLKRSVSIGFAGPGGGGGGQLPPGADLRGAPKCLDVYYKYHCNAYQISRGKVYVNALMFID